MSMKHYYIVHHIVLIKPIRPMCLNAGILLVHVSINIPDLAHQIATRLSIRKDVISSTGLTGYDLNAIFL